jgi:hypothetical protein
MIVKKWRIGGRQKGKAGARPGARRGSDPVLQGQEDFFEDRTTFVHLRVGDVQCRQQPDHGPVRGVDQELALEALGHDRGPVDGELDADHRPLHPHLADVRDLGLKGLEPPAERLADMDRPLQKTLGLDRLDGRQGRPAGDRVAAERGGVGARLELFGNLRLRQQPAQRHAAGDGLGQCDDVRLHVPVLVRVPLARPAHAGLHLVEDEQQPFLVAEPPQ